MEYKIYLLSLLFPILLFGSSQEMIAKKIYQNECSSNPDNLVHWNRGENFPSLGIGHFIWYPKNVNERFVESFPLFIKYLKQNNIPTPKWLSSYAPWKNSNQMKNDPRSKELKDFLIQTMDFQASFMIYRLKSSLDDLSLVKSNYKSLVGSKNGDYILIDYLNFKGLGNNDKEKYNNQGWGLIDVLECMEDPKHPKAEFRRCAKELLKLRVYNAPKNKNEQKWLKGWYNRIETYK